MLIPYFLRNVYGRPHIYIANDDAAECLRVLTGRVTITREQLRALEMLGHTTTLTIDPSLT